MAVSAFASFAFVLDAVVVQVVAVVAILAGDVAQVFEDQTVVAAADSIALVLAVATAAVAVVHPFVVERAGLADSVEPADYSVVVEAAVLV